MKTSKNGISFVHVIAIIFLALISGIAGWLLCHYYFGRNGIINLSEGWLSFYGAFLGGAITFVGVLITISHNQETIRKSFEQEQIIKCRPWIRVETFYSNILLTQIEDQGFFKIIETRDYKNKKERFKADFIEFNKQNTLFPKSLNEEIYSSGKYTYDIIENIGSGPLMEGVYTLKYKVKGKYNELKINIGDIKGEEKIFVPISEYYNDDIIFLNLEITGISIYNEKMIFKIDYKNGKQIVEYSQGNSVKIEKFSSDINPFSCIYINKKSNEEFAKQLED